MQIGKLFNQILHFGSGSGTQILRFFNGFNGDLQSNQSANRVWTLPDKTGTLATLDDIAGGGSGGGNINVEKITISSTITTSTVIFTTTLTPKDINDVLVFVNGEAFSPLVTNPAITISGSAITWNPTNAFYLEPSDKVVVFYPV